MAIKPTTSKKAKKKSTLGATTLLKRLDQAHGLAADRTDDPDEKALYAFAYVAASAALDWVRGDPMGMTFPAAYHDERLAKACRYLDTTLELEQADLLAARAKYAAKVRAAWPAYRDTCADLSHDDASDRPEWSYTWAGINSLWEGETAPGVAAAPAPKLPKFSTPESETWHCFVLVLVTLNHLAGRHLFDLST